MINNILIVGGTHGNELTGVTIVEQWETLKQPLQIEQYSFNTELTLANELAIQKRCRFVDEDLNRQFSAEKLAQLPKLNSAYNEVKVAKRFLSTYGAGKEAKLDVLIDFHNTTAHLGPCLIILKRDPFELALARYMKHTMPEAVILLEDHIAYEDFPYLCTLAKHGIMLELGAQAHGFNDAKIFAAGLQMLGVVLDFCEAWNKGAVPELEAVEAFNLTGDIAYPSDEKVFIHPALLGRDFKALNKGDPCFKSISGEDIQWQGDTSYPHFIGEVAYQHLQLAFSTADKIRL